MLFSFQVQLIAALLFKGNRGEESHILGISPRDDQSYVYDLDAYTRHTNSVLTTFARLSVFLSMASYDRIEESNVCSKQLSCGRYLRTPKNNPETGGKSWVWDPEAVFCKKEKDDAGGSDEWTAEPIEGQNTENHTKAVLVVFTNKRRNLRVFGFRGSPMKTKEEIMSSLIIDTNVELINYPYFANAKHPFESQRDERNIQVFKGFSQAFDLIKDAFQRKMDESITDGYTILFTGHSLGGNLSYIAATHHMLHSTLPAAASSSRPPPPHAIITYAAPKTGNEGFSGLFESLLGCDNVLSFYNEKDPVFNYPYPWLARGGAHLCLDATFRLPVSSKRQDDAVTTTATTTKPPRVNVENLNGVNVERKEYFRREMQTKDPIDNGDNEETIGILRREMSTASQSVLEWLKKFTADTMEKAETFLADRLPTVVKDEGQEIITWLLFHRMETGYRPMEDLFIEQTSNSSRASRVWDQWDSTCKRVDSPEHVDYAT